MRLDTTRVHQILLYITVIVVNYFNPFNRGVILFHFFGAAHHKPQRYCRRRHNTSTSLLDNSKSQDLTANIPVYHCVIALSQWRSPSRPVSSQAVIFLQLLTMMGSTTMVVTYGQKTVYTTIKQSMASIYMIYMAILLRKTSTGRLRRSQMEVSSAAIKRGKLTLTPPPPTTYNTIMIMSSKVNISRPPSTNAQTTIY